MAESAFILWNLHCASMSKELTGNDVDTYMLTTVGLQLLIHFIEYRMNHSHCLLLCPCAQNLILIFLSQKTKEKNFTVENLKSEI